MKCPCNQLLKIAYAAALVAVVWVLTTPNESIAQLRQFRPQMPQQTPPAAPKIQENNLYSPAAPNTAQTPPSPYQGFFQYNIFSNPFSGYQGNVSQFSFGGGGGGFGGGGGGFGGGGNFGGGNIGG